MKKRVSNWVFVFPGSPPFAWPLVLALTPDPGSQLFTSLGPQLEFTGPGPQFVFTDPGAKSVFTGPGPKLYLPTMAPALTPDLYLLYTVTATSTITITATTTTTTTTIATTNYNTNNKRCIRGNKIRIKCPLKDIPH